MRLLHQPLIKKIQIEWNGMDRTGMMRVEIKKIKRTLRETQTDTYEMSAMTSKK